MQFDDFEQIEVIHLVQSPVTLAFPLASVPVEPLALILAASLQASTTSVTSASIADLMSSEEVLLKGLP